MSISPVEQIFASPNQAIRAPRQSGESRANEVRTVISAYHEQYQNARDLQGRINALVGFMNYFGSQDNATVERAQNINVISRISRLIQDLQEQNMNNLFANLRF